VTVAVTVASRVVRVAHDATSPPRASRVVRAAHDAISRGDERKHVATRLGEPRALRPSEARPDRTPRSAQRIEGHRSRLASRAKLVTRGGRTHARSSQGPYARGSCHARELVTRAATLPRESGGNPSGDRRPPTEGRTGRVPRNPVDEETTRLRVRLRALHRVSQERVPFGAHASKKRIARPENASNGNSNTNHRERSHPSGPTSNTREGNTLIRSGEAASYATTANPRTEPEARHRSGNGIATVCCGSNATS